MAQPASVFLPTNPVHLLVTVGTPHQGTPLTTTLDANVVTVNQLSVPNKIDVACFFEHISPCNLGNFFALHLHKRVGAGTQAMEPSSKNLASISSVTSYRAIAGSAPDVQPPPTLDASSDYAAGQLNYLVSAFVAPPNPPETISGIMNTTSHDTIVPLTSQQGADPNAVTITGIVHTNLGKADVAETQSIHVWNQALFWLTGGTGAAPSVSEDANRALTQSGAKAMSQSQAASSGSTPISDLSAYTQVDASNASLSPQSGLAIPINLITNITASSTSKSIIQFQLLQQAVDPTDVLSLYAIQAPFSIPFTPTRLGVANFTAFVFFSDLTYAVTSLTYQLVLSGTPNALRLDGAPTGSISVGTAATVRATATFSTGTVEVTQTAAYQARSGGSAVFSLSPGGVITATGAGTDWLDVTYGGVTASAQIIVGACTYAISPQQATVSSSGTANLSISVPTGCSWTLSSSDNWLTLSKITGAGADSITLTTTANTTGNVRAAYILLGDQVAAITQLATGCTYTVNPTQVTVPAGGRTGTLGVTSSCALVVTSDSNWVVPALADSSTVNYAISRNPNMAARSGTVTVGTQAVTINQLASNAYSVGDVFPLTAYTVGSFGDGEINTLDLLSTLRAVTGIPGAVPTPCSDVFDAMDAFPPDTGSTRGGDGKLNTLDLLALLRRVTNVDPSRPVRTSPAPCPSGAAAHIPETGNPEGTLELVPDGSRTAIYLRANVDMSLSGLGFSLGGDDSPLRFVPADGRAPSLTDTSLLGKLALAWLDGWQAKAGDRVLLGFVEAVAPESLRFFGVSANAMGTGRTVRISINPRLTAR
jgi:hypothetical protein